MDAKEKVLATMKEAGQPLNAGKIAELSGLDRKEVDAAMKQLKAEGAMQMGTCRVRFILLS
jgi:predicted transcriptional regulator